MARWITGSARTRAKMKAARPPAPPASRPRARSRPSTFWGGAIFWWGAMSVAGEAEEVSGVMHEFVHVGVGPEHRGGALVDPDEVVGQHRQHCRAEQPQEGGVG